MPTSGSGRGSCTARLRGKQADAAASTRSRTSGSASEVHATPTSRSASASSGRGWRPGASARIIAAHAAVVRAIGPPWSKLGASGKQPSSDTSPWLGLNPTTPQHAAGMRIDPPESVPIAPSASPSASAAAFPPLDPPATRPGASGLGTVP
jgi:hypothetical protein